MLFMGEALLLGLVGYFVGVALGIALATQLIGAVSKNITSLYLLLSIKEIFVSPWAVFSGAGLALGAVGLASWFPSREASLLSPVEALSLGHLEGQSRARTTRWLAVAGGLAVISVLLGWCSRTLGPAWLSFGCALFCLLAFSFTVPWVNQQVSRWIRPRPLTWRMAFQHFGHSLHRNSVTVAALVTALAMLVGITVMIHSFRSTVETWLNRSVTADLFIAPVAGLVVGNRETLRPEVEAAVKQVTGVAVSDRYRELRVRVDGRPVKLAAIGFETTAARNPLEMKGANGADVMRLAARNHGVLVNESFSRKFHRREGDTLELATADGTKSFTITGVFTDYTTESGLVLLDWETYRESWNDDHANSLALYVAPGVNAAEVQAQLKEKLKPLGDFLIYSNAELRTQVFQIFDQTFSVTYVLQTIGILVSGLGICLALTILVAERQREIGLLRAVGARMGQVREMVLIEAGLLGLVGSLLGLVAGLALAAVLTYVINVAFFGWTIHWSVPWGFLAALPIFVTAVAVLAGAWPAREAGKIEIADAVKME
jgi:putative ABC transport system permease protein